MPWRFVKTSARCNSEPFVISTATCLPRTQTLTFVAIDTMHSEAAVFLLLYEVDAYDDKSAFIAVVCVKSFFLTSNFRGHSNKT